MNSEDKNWLLTKCLTVSIVWFVLLGFSVVTSFVLGLLSAVVADSRLIGAIVAFMVYFSSISGRKYLMDRMGRAFFSKKEEEYMIANSIARPYSED